VVVVVVVVVKTRFLVSGRSILRLPLLSGSRVKEEEGSFPWDNFFRKEGRGRCLRRPLMHTQTPLYAQLRLWMSVCAPRVLVPPRLQRPGPELIDRLTRGRQALLFLLVSRGGCSTKVIEVRTTC